MAALFFAKVLIWYCFVSFPKSTKMYLKIKKTVQFISNESITVGLECANDRVLINHKRDALVPCIASCLDLYEDQKEGVCKFSTEKRKRTAPRGKIKIFR
jgi:hypothetical protein